MTDPILSRLVAVPGIEHARHVRVHAHMLDDGAYIVLRALHDNTESSAQGDGYWHRWMRFEIDDVEYVIHDPRRYDTDPIDRTDHLAELMDMMNRVVAADDMGPAEKVRELSRLAARMQEIAPDGASESLDVVADGLAENG